MSTNDNIAFLPGIFKIVDKSSENNLLLKVYKIETIVFENENLELWDAECLSLPNRYDSHDEQKKNEYFEMLKNNIETNTRILYPEVWNFRTWATREWWIRASHSKHQKIIDIEYFNASRNIFISLTQFELIFIPFPSMGYDEFFDSKINTRKFQNPFIPECFLKQAGNSCFSKNKKNLSQEFICNNNFDPVLVKKYSLTGPAYKCISILSPNNNINNSNNDKMEIETVVEKRPKNIIDQIKKKLSSSRSNEKKIINEARNLSPFIQESKGTSISYFFTEPKNSKKKNFFEPLSPSMNSVKLQEKLKSISIHQSNPSESSTNNTSETQSKVNSSKNSVPQSPKSVSFYNNESNTISRSPEVLSTSSRDSFVGIEPTIWDLEEVSKILSTSDNCLAISSSFEKTFEKKN